MPSCTHPPSWFDWGDMHCASPAWWKWWNLARYGLLPATASCPLPPPARYRLLPATTPCPMPPPARCCLLVQLLPQNSSILERENGVFFFISSFLDVKALDYRANVFLSPWKYNFGGDHCWSAAAPSHEAPDSKAANKSILTALFPPNVVCFLVLCLKEQQALSGGSTDRIDGGLQGELSDQWGSERGAGFGTELLPSPSAFQESRQSWGWCW